MINNLKLIKPLLNFDKDGDFYMLYIFKRKKDQPEGEKENVQSIRTIKTYCIESIEHLEKRWDEITHLCEYFKARAYIHVQKQNHKDVGLEMMIQLANRLKDGNSNFKNLFDSVVGQIKVLEKRWIVDVDTKDEKFIFTVLTTIENCEPITYNEWVTNVDGIDYPQKEIVSKIIQQIPTKNGYHFITKPFNVEQFKHKFILQPELIPDIQRKNPTLLYFPNSLN